MKDWRNRKFIHWDGNERCIRISKHYSIAFDTFLFKIFFSNRFRLPRKGRLAKGSIFWETLSWKKKLFDPHHGLAGFFRFNTYSSKSPYHGVDNWRLSISFLPLSLNYYYNEKEYDGCDVSCSQI